MGFFYLKCRPSRSRRIKRAFRGSNIEWRTKVEEAVEDLGGQTP
jgi:hypothetical protein